MHLVFESAQKLSLRPQGFGALLRGLRRLRVSRFSGSGIRGLSRISCSRVWLRRYSAVSEFLGVWLTWETGGSKVLKCSSKGSSVVSEFGLWWAVARGSLPIKPPLQWPVVHTKVGFENLMDKEDWFYNGSP
jgi:hypothetical protein